ncbi:MAG TPA: redoxin domain-containing protein [Pirellulaceae bacterium]|nr:redoxin domain-containing protein [Pirellulaceae bacterium]
MACCRLFALPVVAALLLSRVALAQAPPAEAKPAETRPAEAKPAEAKPDEAKPDEKKPEDKKPEEKKPDDKPAESPTTAAGPLPGHSYHGEVFDEGPRQKAYLMEGMPKIHFPVTTKNPEVQKFIEQGVGQIHGFWYYEAERSFRQAATLDKDCALAYWGMALANIDNANRAKKFMAECVKHKAGISDRETMYIDAADAYFKADNNKRKERNEAYTKALERILYKYPDDIEARAFLALQLWKNRDGGTPIASFLAIDALLDQVFKADPMHPAHHYRIHLWDTEKAENALGSAALGGQSSPGVAHMWHMPGHIYSRTKRYEDACYQQEASARVDHAHMMRDRVLPDQIHNFAHNNEWLIRDMIFVGRMRDAIDLAKNMCELPRHPKYNTPNRGSANFGRLRLFESLTRFEAWDELIALAETPYLDATDNDQEQLKRQRHLGMAHYRKGDVAGGDAQLAALEQKLADQKAAQEKAGADAEQKAKDDKKDDKAVEKAKNDARKPFDQKINNLTKAVEEVKGHQAVAQGEFKSGLELLRKAGGIDADYLAWVQFKAGDTDKAIEAAQGAVRSRKNEVIPLARLVELQWLAGKKDDAKQSLDQLRELSNSIDKSAPLYARLAPIAQELGFSEDWKATKAPLPDTGVRPSLDSLGPFRWQPSPALSWTLKDDHGADHSLADFHGKPVVLLFFLGHGCLHCAEQVQAFGKAAKDFSESGIELIGISSDDAAGLKQSIENYKDGPVPFPLVSDNALETFKTYRCYDDFEQLTLHGTFLIDGAGLVRWQDISYEPFQDTKFLLTEARRLLGQSADGK